MIDNASQTGKSLSLHNQPWFASNLALGLTSFFLFRDSNSLECNDILFNSLMQDGGVGEQFKASIHHVLAFFPHTGRLLHARVKKQGGQNEECSAH